MMEWAGARSSISTLASRGHTYASSVAQVADDFGLLH